MTECEELIESFERVFRCHVCVHDYYGRVLACAGRIPLHHRNKFCETVGLNRRAFALCCEMEAEMTRARLQKELRPIVKRCHAGVFEIALPLLHEGRLMGALFAGPFRLPHGPEGAVLEQKRSGEFAPSEVEMPLLERLAAKDLMVLASTLERSVESALAVADAPEKETAQGRLIRRFVETNFRRRPKLSELARELGVGDVRACQILKSECGKGFSALLNERRMAHAKRLLQDSRMKSEAIAADCGFSSSPYFFRVFKESEGMTPLEYRRRFQRRGVYGGELLC